MSDYCSRLECRCARTSVCRICIVCPVVSYLRLQPPNFGWEARRASLDLPMRVVY